MLYQFFKGKEIFVADNVIFYPRIRHLRDYTEIRRRNFHLNSRGLDLHLRDRKSITVALKQSNKNSFNSYVT